MFSFNDATGGPKRTGRTEKGVDVIGCLGVTHAAVPQDTTRTK